VETEKAISISGGLEATIDPFLYDIRMILHPQSSLDEILETTEAELTRAQTHPPSPEELSRAVKQARALFAYGSESISNQAFWLGFSEMFASYDWFTGYLEKLAAVTPEDVQRVAQTYLRPQNRVLGVYVPVELPQEMDEEEA
jgi:zinc protease